LPPDWSDLRIFLACDYFTTAPASEPGKAGMLFWQAGGWGDRSGTWGGRKIDSRQKFTDIDLEAGGEPKTFAQAVMGDVGPTTSAAS